MNDIVPKKIGTPAVDKHYKTWVQTERKAHEAWASLIAKKPKAAQLMHHFVALMGSKNAVVINQKTLAKLMNCSVRTVQYAIQELVTGKWIEVVQLNGQGTVSAYVVNDRVAWADKRENLRLSAFSANVIANYEDQNPDMLTSGDLRKIPALYEGEAQLPSGEGEPPPSQLLLEGTMPDLPFTTQDND